MSFSQGDIPLSPSEQNVSLVILGILVVIIILGVVLGPYLWSAWQDLMKELKNLKR